MVEINDITRPNLIPLELIREEIEKAYNDGLSGLNSFHLAVKDALWSGLHHQYHRHRLRWE